MAPESKPWFDGHGTLSTTNLWKAAEWDGEKLTAKDLNEGFDRLSRPARVK